MKSKDTKNINENMIIRMHSNKIRSSRTAGANYVNFFRVQYKFRMGCKERICIENIFRQQLGPLGLCLYRVGVGFNDVLKDSNSKPGLISNVLVTCYKKPFINFTRPLTNNRNKYEGFSLQRGCFTRPETFYNRVLHHSTCHPIIY